MKYQCFNAILSAVFVALLSGCGMFASLDEVVPDNTKKYRKAKTMPPLDVPPDLSTQSINDDIVGNNSVNTYSEFAQAASNPLASKYNIAPDTKPMLSGAGNQRHLIVPNKLDITWQRVLAFWQEIGLNIKRQETRIGLMDTQPDTDGYAYRVRVEQGDVLTRTNVYLTGTRPETTITEKDEAMLRQLADFLGRLHQADQAQYEQQQASDKQQAPKMQLTLVEEADNYHFLQANRDFFEVWQQVGYVLDNKGFAVEDRDRSQGIYFINYIDPDQEAVAAPGILDKLMFWRDDSQVMPQVFYHIKLISAADKTKIIILDAEKTRSNSDTAKKLLVLMQEQLAL